MLDNLAWLQEHKDIMMVVRLVLAAILGGIVGIERGSGDRPAGFRTHILVCVGSALFMLVSMYGFDELTPAEALHEGDLGARRDSARIAAQVVSGIGFLGAGTIIVTRRHQVKGLTTAAGLWASAGVGLALGIGFYEGAVAGAFSVLVVMTFLQKMDTKMHSSTRSLDIYFEVSSSVAMSVLLPKIRASGFEINDVQKTASLDLEDDIRAYTAIIKTKKRRPQSETVEKLMSIDGVVYAEAL